MQPEATIGFSFHSFIKPESKPAVRSHCQSEAQGQDVFIIHK